MGGGWDGGSREEGERQKTNKVKRHGRGVGST